MKEYNSIDYNEHFYYDESSPTGLRWKHYNGSRNPKLKRFKDEYAGHMHSYPDGKRKECMVSVNAVQYKVHRIIWILHNGHLSDKLLIDHIDGDPWNNKISNLRAVDDGVNARNSALSTSNKTGKNGVCLCTKKRKTRPDDHYVVISYYNYLPKRIYVRKHFNLNEFPSVEHALEFGELYLTYMRDIQFKQGFEFTERHGK